MPSILIDSNKFSFPALAVKLTSSPSISIALRFNTMLSPSSETASGSEIEDITGASFTFSISTLNAIEDELNPPASLASTFIVPVPTLFSNGLIVNVDPTTLIVNKSVSEEAINVKSVSPSISVAFNEISVDVSSKTLTFETATIAGASLTGFIVTSKLAEEVTWPSDTSTVILVLPLKLASGVIRTLYPPTIDADTLGFVELTDAASSSPVSRS